MPRMLRHISALVLLASSAALAVCADGISIAGPEWLTKRQQGSWTVRLPEPCAEKLVFFWRLGKSFVLDSTGTFKTSFDKTGNYWIHLQVAQNRGKGLAAESLMVRITDQAVLIDRLPESLSVSVQDRVSFEPRIRTLAPIARIRWYFLGTRIWQFQSQETGAASNTYYDKGVFHATIAVTDANDETVRDTVVVTVTDHPPTVRLPRDTTIAGHDSLRFTFSARDDGRIVKVRWDFEGDGKWDWASAEAIFPSHRYPFSGKDKMALRPRVEVMDDDGRTALDSFSLQIVHKIPRADAGRSMIVCLGDTVTYNGWQSLAPVGEIETWEWDFNADGRIDTISRYGEIRRAAPRVPGSYSSLLRVVDEYGNRSFFDSVKVVVVEDRPKALVDTAVTVGVGDTTWFRGEGLKRCGGVIEFAWDFDGDGKWDWKSAVNEKLPYVFHRPGNYYAKFQVTGDDGVRGSAIRIIRVKQR